MKRRGYLLDTHALVFWRTGEHLPESLRTTLDRAAARGRVLVSSISFWEVALLARKGKIQLDDVTAWKDEVLAFSGALLAHPSVDEMVESTLLPPVHKDPFDRLLVTQARHLQVILVSRDAVFRDYDVDTFWE